MYLNNGSVRTPKKRTRTAATGKTLLIDRIVKWFAVEKQPTATIKQLTDALKVSKSSVRQVLYTTNRDRFEKAGTLNRETQFKLKE